MYREVVISAAVDDEVVVDVGMAIEEVMADAGMAIEEVDGSCTQFSNPLGHDEMYTSEVEVFVNVKSVKMVGKAEVVVIVSVVETIETAGVVLVGKGSTVAGCVGAPEKPGSA